MLYEGSVFFAYRHMSVTGLSRQDIIVVLQ